MNFERLDNAVKYSRAYKRKKLRLRIVSGLAALVIFITTYALILPAATKERATFCGYTEHTHDSECLAHNCVLTEHEHNASCYINYSTDLESKADWESTLPKDLTGVWTEDVINIAESQLGYREVSNNVATSDEATPDQAVNNGYTRYGDWYGTPYADWSSIFVNFCLNYAKVDKDYFPYFGDNAQWVEKLGEKELLSDTPHLGDIIFFRKGNAPDKKTGIVTDLIYEGDVLVRIKVIEGDSRDRVRYNEYSAVAEQIYGYGHLAKAYDHYFADQPIIKTYSHEGVTVTAKYSSAAGIPEDAEFVVKVMDRDNCPEEFQARYDEAFNKLESENLSINHTRITGFRLYDIHFLHNGIEIQPTEKVDISISYPVSSYSEASKISVLHYAEEGTEIPESEFEFDKSGNLITNFETESFSLFAIVTSETTQNNILNLSQYAVSSSTILNGLDGMTFALVNGNCALDVKEGKLVVNKVELRTDSSLSAYEASVRWTFERNGTNKYYLHTTVDGTKYYLVASNGALSLGTSGTLFTAARSSNAITLSGDGKYVNISSSGAVAGSSQALSLYQINSGSFTATFDGKIGAAVYMGASNVKFGNATVITRESDSDGYITLPTVAEAMKTEPANYPVTLNGWYDIINSVYYDRSMFGTKIKITSDTIFYPEWIPLTYDIGKNKDVVTNQPDTSSFINTYVYDYNELFNVHSSYYNVSEDKWYFDPDSELGFIFFDYINPSGNIGYIKNKDTAVNGVTVNAEKTYGTRGSNVTFPGTITKGIANEARIEALFGDTPVVGKHSLGEGDWFYSYDENTGFYYYNSAKNAASYNQSEQRFYVYNHTVKIQTPSDNSFNDFLPFNYGDVDDYDSDGVRFAEKDNEANYWYGIKSEITFYLPDDTGTVDGNKSASGEDMQFRFSGDDDVWVFVDDKLVLDLGGVHDMVYGEINFATGEVKTGQATSSSNVAVNAADSYTEMPGLSGTAGVTLCDPIELPGGQEHTITIYYLERGSSLSNCAIYFNLSPLYQLKLSKKDSDDNHLLAGATFQAFSDKECTIPAELYTKWEDGTIHPIEDSTFTTDENGIATCWGLFAGKTYYIKEIHAPPGYSNMSEYVIEFTLSKDGDSVFVMIDSNGTDWEFAGTYHYAGGEDHLIELDVYNHKYIGGDGRFAVEKVWAEGSQGIPESITVYLYANGEYTGRSIVLNADNNWSAIFYELPQTDQYGNEIVYTVHEEAISGFKPTYEEIDRYYEVEEEKVTITDVPGYWERVTSITSGGVYRLISNSSGSAITNSSGSSVTLATPTDEPIDSQMWSVSGSGTSYSFKNVATNRYLTLSSDGVSTQTSSVSITYNSNYKLSRRSGLRTYYLRDNNGNITTTTSSSYGAAVHLYRWVEPTTKEETTIVTNKVYYKGYKITNTPATDFDLLVEKLWDATIADDNKKDVTVNLYLVTIGAEDDPEFVSSITLTETNGWKDSFDDLAYPEDGTYYAVMEATDEYSASYNGEKVTITLDNRSKEAHRVNINESGTAVTVVITNSALLLLPETGGWGIYIIPIIGILLVAVTALLIFFRKKIKI